MHASHFEHPPSTPCDTVGSGWGRWAKGQHVPPNPRSCADPCVVCVADACQLCVFWQAFCLALHPPARPVAAGADVAGPGAFSSCCRQLLGWCAQARFIAGRFLAPLDFVKCASKHRSLVQGCALSGFWLFFLSFVVRTGASRCLLILCHAVASQSGLFVGILLPFGCLSTLYAFYRQNKCRLNLAV